MQVTFYLKNISIVIFILTLIGATIIYDIKLAIILWLLVTSQNGINYCNAKNEKLKLIKELTKTK